MIRDSLTDGFKMTRRHKTDSKLTKKHRQERDGLDTFPFLFRRVKPYYAGSDSFRSCSRNDVTDRRRVLGTTLRRMLPHNTDGDSIELDLEIESSRTPLLESRIFSRFYIESSRESSQSGGVGGGRNDG